MDCLFGSCFTTLFVGIISAVLLYWYSTRNFDYWKKRGIKYTKAYPFIGSVWEYFGRPGHEVEVERYKRLGRIYGHFEANQPLISVADPVLLRDILVKDFSVFPNRRTIVLGDNIVDNMVSVIEGEDWKRIRSIITPAFSTGKMKRMISIIKDCTKTIIQNFKAESADGKPVNVKRIYGGFTMDIIASAAFSTKVDSHNDPDNSFVKMAKNVFGKDLSWRFALLQIAPWFIKLFKIRIVSATVTDFFKQVTLQIIEERKRTGQKRNDFLQLLIDCAKEVAEEEKTEGKEDITSNYGGEDNSQMFKNVTNKKLSLDELVAQCVIFFLAGYDTTGSTLTIATYLLALNPDIQDKVYEEIRCALETSKGELTYDTIQDMKYLDNVISEGLRMFPPAFRLERVAARDYKLGDTGLTIPKGMIVSVPNVAMHYDPKHFPDPETFNPDRFTPQEKAKRDPYAYLPFGSGPRNCLGMRFALMEIKVCLVHVLSTFRVKKCSETSIPLTFESGLGLLQPNNVLLTLEPRETNILHK